jgi:hypothetical protein
MTSSDPLNPAAPVPPTADEGLPDLAAPDSVAPGFLTAGVVAPDVVAPDVVAPDLVAPDLVAPDLAAPEAGPPLFTPAPPAVGNGPVKLILAVTAALALTIAIVVPTLARAGVIFGEADGPVPAATATRVVTAEAAPSADADALDPLAPTLEAQPSAEASADTALPETPDPIETQPAAQTGQPTQGAGEDPEPTQAVEQPAPAQEDPSAQLPPASGQAPVFCAAFQSLGTSTNGSEEGLEPLRQVVESLKTAQTDVPAQLAGDLITAISFTEGLLAALDSGDQAKMAALDTNGYTESMNRLNTAVATVCA